MKPRISSIRFDARQRLLSATILTPAGTVKVSWQEVCGDRCWFTTGTGEAKRLAVPSIELIERMLSLLNS